MITSPSDDALKALLATVCRIAIVGISNKPDRASHRVARYLQAAGYEILPVNPRLHAWEGLPAYPTLQAIPGPIDLVDVFRKSEEIAPVVADALAKGCRAFWLQLGIRNDEAVAPLLAQGITVVQELCLKVEHQRLFGSP